MSERLSAVMDGAMVLLAQHPYLKSVLVSSLLGLAVWCGCALFVIAAEMMQKNDLAAYGRRSALNDLGYVLFYRCSLFALLAGPVVGWLGPRLEFLHLRLLHPLPPLVGFLLCWVVVDFVNYWIHRLQHAVGPLWAFHSVHHAANELTFMTAHRIHFFEQLYMSVLLMVPVLLLGVPATQWLPILLAQTLCETLQHARLEWAFGPLYRFVVSPNFHRLHHSIDPRDHDSNYGRVFAVWDVLFGTLVPARSRVKEFGVEGMFVKESLLAQFVHPFRMLVPRVRRSEVLSEPKVTVSS